MKVAGKVAIVTGGGGGIGGALVEELTTHGARVLVADLDAARAQAVADKINALGRGPRPQPARTSPTRRPFAA